MYQSAATYVAQKKSRFYCAILLAYAQGMEKPAQGGQGGQSGKRKARARRACSLDYWH